MKEDLDALSKNNTWDLVTLSSRKFVVGCKWIYKIKTHSDGSIEQYKACFVIKGFIQKYKIDYEECGSIDYKAWISSVHAPLVVVAASKWDIFQMDVKYVFLNVNLSEKVYIQPPPGFSIEPNKICHLQRAFYGLK